MNKLFYTCILRRNAIQIVGASLRLTTLASLTWMHGFLCAALRQSTTFFNQQRCPSLYHIYKLHWSCVSFQNIFVILQYVNKKSMRFKKLIIILLMIRSMKNNKTTNRFFMSGYYFFYQTICIFLRMDFLHSYQ